MAVAATAVETARKEARVTLITPPGQAVVRNPDPVDEVFVMNILAVMWVSSGICPGESFYDPAFQQTLSADGVPPTDLPQVEQQEEAAVQSVADEH